MYQSRFIAQHIFNCALVRDEWSDLSPETELMVHMKRGLGEPQTGLDALDKIEIYCPHCQ
jgi:hypothetical protein